MKALSNRHLFKNLAIVIGTAGAAGFLSIPIAMHLATRPTAVADLFSSRADAQTTGGSSGSQSGQNTGGSSGSSTGGSSGLNTSNQGSQGSSGQSTSNQGTQSGLGAGVQPQPSLFPGQGNSSGLGNQQNTGITPQGSQPVGQQSNPGSTQLSPGGQTFQPLPGSQNGTNSTNSGSTTNGSSNNGLTTNGLTTNGSGAVAPTDGVQQFPNNVTNGTTRQNGTTRNNNNLTNGSTTNGTTNGTTTGNGTTNSTVTNGGFSNGTTGNGTTGNTDGTQNQVPTGAAAANTGLTPRSQRAPNTTVISPGILEPGSAGSQTATPTSQQFATQPQTGSRQVSQSSGSQQSFGQSGQTSAQSPASTSSQQGVNQVTTQGNQSGGAVRALW